MKILVQRVDNCVTIDTLFTVESFTPHVGETLILPPGPWHMERYYIIKEVGWDLSEKQNKLRLFVKPLTGNDYMV